MRGRQREALADGGLDLVDRQGGIDRGHELLALEDLDQRAGLLVVLGQPDGQGFGIVVGPGDEGAPADVAGVLVLGPVGDQVVVQPALGAQPAGEDPPVHLLVGEVQVDDPVDVVALEEELGLAGVAGEPVDDEAEVPVVGGQAVAHHRLDQVVADQVAAGHDALDLGAELRVVLDVPAEDVADADVLEVEVLGQQLGLGALAAALDAHDDELAHGRLPTCVASGREPVT